MIHKKEHLEALLKVVDEVCAEKSNEWFLAELQKKFAQPVVTQATSDELLQRIFGRKFKHLGNQYYQKVTDIKLRHELTSNFKQMRLAYLMGNYVEYAKRITLQLEGIFSYIFEQINALTIIKQRQLTNSSTNIINLQGNPNSAPIDYNLYPLILNQDGSLKLITEVFYKVKAIFCLDYYKIPLFQKNWGNFSNIYMLRNYDSHAKITATDEEKITRNIFELPSKLVFYEKMFSDYSSCIIKYFENGVSISSST